MIQSMTGFGRAEVEEEGLSLRVELRTVNHRFLQVRHRLPPDLGELEPKLDALVKQRISRGSLSTNVSIVRSAAPGSIALDVQVARRYRQLLSRAARELDIRDELSLATLVGLPGVVGMRPDERRHRRELALVQRATESALDELVASRAAEGKSLERDLRRNAAAIRRLVARIGKRMPGVVRAHMQNLERRVRELAQEATGVQPSDLARELALIADRVDVSEELARLASHMGQLEAVLDKGGAVGRQLDFLVQELHREANTIGSKCNDAEVAHLVVELKTHIERVREQVQNVE